MDADLRALIDRAEITEVVARFHRAVDNGDWELMRTQVLAEDASYDWVASDASGVMEDAAAGREVFIAWLTRAMVDSTVRHLTVSHLIDLQDGEAHSSSYMFVVDSTSLVPRAVGMVEADHVRTPEGWRIRRMHIDERISDGSIEAMKSLVGG